MDKYQVLKQYFGHTNFRQGQEELIDSILQGRDAFGIMPTGAGKSVCYQIPALLFNGITLVVSPLISLMKDQVNALIQAGIKAAYLNSSLTQGQFTEVLRRAALGAYKIIYVAPERLTTEGFLRFARQADIAMVTVDEAHCVSQWGQDFRPSYLKIVEFIKQLEKRPVISAFTATATKAVREDVVQILDLQDPTITITGFDRVNLYFEVRKPSQKLRALLEIIWENKDKSGIVYCATRKNVELVYAKLIEAGYAAARYHAGLSDEERRINQDDFLYDRKTLMVATNAFGMGIDKSNVSFVVHYNMPKNLESYYQEAGRAGRDGEPAQCILLYSGQDVRTNQYLIEHSPEVNQELTEEMRQAIKEKELERLKDMTVYCSITECLRAYMLRYFGETTANYCGNCSNCNTNFETVDVTVEVQKIVSCVWRLAKRNQYFGKTLIVEILRGSKNEKIRRLGLDQLSTYGIMADLPAAKVHSVLDFLIYEGFLELSAGEYPVVQLSKRWEEIIGQKITVEMKLAKTQHKVSIEERLDKKSWEQNVHAIDQGLFDALRALRNQLAAEARVPAYIIFTDATLRDMCRKMPQSLAEFLQVSGVGKAKMERYGEAFLAAIRDYKK